MSRVMTDQVLRDKVISVVYAIHDQQGETFERTEVPVNYIYGGKSELFEKIEKALDGKTIGDKIEVTLAPDEAFGSHDPGLTFTDNIENVPVEARRIGAQLEAQNANGDVLQFVVKNIDNEKMTVDGNHPLVGQTVKFFVEVKAIRDATEQEKATGAVAERHQSL